MNSWEQRIRAASVTPTLSSRVRADFVACLAELDALRKDAERYRWLRDNPWPPILEADIVLHRNARWDAEIDAAMAASLAVGAA